MGAILVASSLLFYFNRATSTLLKLVRFESSEKLQTDILLSWRTTVKPYPDQTTRVPIGCLWIGKEKSALRTCYAFLSSRWCGWRGVLNKNAQHTPSTILCAHSCRVVSYAFEAFIRCYPRSHPHGGVASWICSWRIHLVSTHALSVARYVQKGLLCNFWFWYIRFSFLLFVFHQSIWIKLGWCLYDTSWLENGSTDLKNVVLWEGGLP